MEQVIQKYIDELLECSTVKDGNGYALGRQEGTPVFGLYLKPVDKTVLHRVEKKAKRKFQLEMDAENYSQEARVIFFQKMREYIDKKGQPTNEQEESNMFGYLYKACNNSLTNLARCSKSNRSVYDYTQNDFSIMQVLSVNEETERLPLLEKEIEDKLSEREAESFCDFRDWFNENKSKILTKKQLAYLEDELSVMESNRARMNKTISERVYRKYTDNSIIERRIEKIKHRIEILHNIALSSKTDKQLMFRLVNSMKKESWLIDVVYMLSFATCNMITKACKGLEYECNKKSVKEIRDEIQKLYNYNLSILEGLEKKL